MVRQLTSFFFFFNDTATTEIYTLPYTTLFRSHHDGEGEAQVGNEWEGVPRRAGHGLRRDQGKHFLREGAAQDLLLSRRHVRPPQDPDAMRGEGREEIGRASCRERV